MSSPEFSDDLSGSWASHSSSSICTSLHSKQCLTTDDQTAAHVCTLCYDITIKSTYITTNFRTRHAHSHSALEQAERVSWLRLADRSRVPGEEGGESIPCCFPEGHPCSSSLRRRLKRLRNPILGPRHKQRRLQPRWRQTLSQRSKVLTRSRSRRGDPSNVCTRL